MYKFKLYKLPLNVITDALTGLGLADISVAVAVAEDAEGEGPAVGRIVVVARGAGLAELADVALGTAAVLDPVGWLAGSPAVSRLQAHVVQVAPACGLRRTDVRGM